MGDARMNARERAMRIQQREKRRQRRALTIIDEDNDADDVDHANVAAGSRDSADAMNASCAAPDVVVRLLQQVSMVRRRLHLRLCGSFGVGCVEGLCVCG